MNMWQSTALLLLLLATPATARDFDPAVLRAAGIRQVNGQHLTLYTDVPSSPAVDELPAVFDLAVPEWQQYFRPQQNFAQTWRVNGYLIRDKDRFERARMVPASLPQFVNGYSRGSEFWFFEQPSDYYRRHLMLHEGTHLFMETSFGGGGPPWHFEGLAELLATHRYEAGRLTLNYFPRNRNEVPMWGRIRAIREAVAAGQPLSLDVVLNFDNRAHARVEAYAWCWAAAAFLDRHPRYRDRFRQLCPRSAKQGFNDRFREAFADDWRQLNAEWQLFANDLEYGYDIERTVIDFTPGRDLPAAGGRVTVAADRGWQNTGWRLTPGVKYQLSASGRFQVAETTKVWWCEPGGVSIHYYRGKPLGRLLAAVVADELDPADNGFLHPIDIGLGTELTSPEGGTLYLRINESSAELADNRGELAVEIKPDR